MRRRLSSRSTPFYKVFPLIWGSWFGFFTLWLFINNPPLVDKHGQISVLSGLIKWLFLLVSVGLLWGTSWTIRNLKNVVWEDATLLVSRFWARSAVAVPLTDVITVREMKWPLTRGTRLIVVELSDTCAFGQRIIFLPAGAERRSQQGQRLARSILQELRAVAAHNATAPQRRGLR